MARPIVTSVTLVAAVSNGIATTQALPGASGLNLVFNGSLVTNGVAVFDAPRRVVIHSNGNDSGLTWTVTGTARTQQSGIVQSETIAGVNAADAVSTQDYATVTSISASGATASTVTAGTSATGSGPWVPWNQDEVAGFAVSIVGYVMSGSPTWGVEYTYDDVFGTWLPSNVPFPRALPLQTLSGQTGTAEGNLSSPVRASRLTLTTVGSVQLTQTQQGW